MMTADEIVDGCGGTSALAATLDLTPSTVSSWRQANFIPRWWQTQVREAAAKAEFSLPGDGFPAKSERRSVRSKPAQAAA